MVPKKVRLMSLMSGIIAAAIAGSILSAFGIQSHWIVGVSVLTGFVGIFWATGLVTREEVWAALGEEYLTPEQICHVINRYRGLGPIDEFNQCSIFWIEIVLSNLRHEGLIQDSVSRVCADGRESITYYYRLKQTEPAEHVVTRITRHHLHGSHPSI